MDGTNISDSDLIKERLAATISSMEMCLTELEESGLTMPAALLDHAIQQAKAHL